VNFRQQFDYSDGFYAASNTLPAEAVSGGGAWNASDWDEFFWSLPLTTQVEANVDGVGRNMSLLIFTESSVDEPYVLQGLLTHYKVIGMNR
jgi:hypothetical protein